MKRIIFLFGVCLAIAFVLFTVSASAEEPAWVLAYEQMLTDKRIQISEEPVEYSSPELWYLVYDIDKDGTPEMIIKTGTCEADYGKRSVSGTARFTAIPAKTGSS